MYYTNLPIEIGQDYRQKSIHNFKWLLDKVNAIDETIDKHKNSSRYAHDAKNLLFKNGSVHVELNYLRNLIINLVLGHNGDGVQELRDSRTAIDGANFPLLSRSEERRVGKECRCRLRPYHKRTESRS